MKTRDGLELGAVTAFVITAFLFAGYLLYGAGAASNTSNLTKFMFYGVLAGLVLIGLTVRVYLDNRGVLDAPELSGFKNITAHSPEDTWIGKTFPNFVKPLVMTSFFLMVSMFFGAMVSISGQFATGTPELVTGSVSASTSLGLAVEPAVSTETLIFNMLVLFGTAAGLTYLLVRSGVSPGFAWVASKVVSVLTTSVFFLLYHNFRYGAQESSQFSIFLLGLITNTSAAATHSIIPAYLIHASGNFFSKATQAGIFSNELSIVVAVAVMIFSGLGFLYTFFQEVTG
jgi:hypothetical protein